jgi:hypothetical protein
MPEGVEVRPENLRRAAAQLHDDAARLGPAVDQATDGAGAAAGAAGDGPLAEAADALAARLLMLLGAVTVSVTESADALDAASAQYLATDRAAARSLGGPAVEPGAGDAGPPIVLPGLEPPR